MISLGIARPRCCLPYQLSSWPFLCWQAKALPRIHRRNHSASCPSRYDCEAASRWFPARRLVSLPVRLLAGPRGILRNAAGRTLQRGERVFRRRCHVFALRRPAAGAGQRHALFLQRRPRRRSLSHLLDARDCSRRQTPQLRLQRGSSEGRSQSCQGESQGQRQGLRCTPDQM